MLFIIGICIAATIYSIFNSWRLYKENIEMSNIIQQQAELIKEMIKDENFYIIELEKRKR